MAEEERPLRRSDDPWHCWCAKRLQEFWDWIDRRQIDAYCLSVAIIVCSYRIANWAMAFADLHPDKPGLEVAAIVGAVMLPWSGVQLAAVKFLFDARTKTFLPEEKK